MKGLIWVFLLAILVALLTMAIGLVFTTLPGYVQVDRDAAFVYPDGEHTILALPEGAYEVGPGLVGGCYHLLPPETGQPYGRAEWAWYLCGK